MFLYYLAGGGFTGGAAAVDALYSTSVTVGELLTRVARIPDFEPISLLLNVSYLIVARKAIPANDLQGLISWLKANPDTATEGTSGVGSAQHFGGVSFQKLTGTRFQFVPYRSTLSQFQPGDAGFSGGAYRLDDGRGDRCHSAIALGKY